MSNATSEMLEGASEKKSTITPAFKRGRGGKKKSVTGNVDTVCVALNRPYGLEFAMPDGRNVTIAGNGQTLVGREKGVLPVGAYGLTTIAKSDWEYILKVYGRAKVFTNGLCFAAGRKADAVDEADQRGDLRNGFEPVDTEKTATRALSAE